MSKKNIGNKFVTELFREELNYLNHISSQKVNSVIRQQTLVAQFATPGQVEQAAFMTNQPIVALYMREKGVFVYNYQKHAHVGSVPTELLLDGLCNASHG